MSKKGVALTKKDSFNIGEICEESGIYQVKDSACKSAVCTSEEQREIPLAKGHRFPPCRNCKGTVTWHFMRKA